MRITQFLVIVAVLLVGCSEPADPAKSEAAASWLRQYYEKVADKSQRWVVTKIEVDSNQLNVVALLPEGDAKMIMSMEREPQFLLVSKLLCPSKREDIWNILDPKRRLVVQAGGSSGIFIDVDCGFWRKT